LQRTLEKAIVDKVEAEQERDDAISKFTEREMLISELDHEVRVLHAESCQKSLHIDLQLAKIHELEDDIAKLTKDKDDLTEENKQKVKNKNNL